MTLHHAFQFPALVRRQVLRQRSGLFLHLAEGVLFAIAPDLIRTLQDNLELDELAELQQVVSLLCEDS